MTKRAHSLSDHRGLRDLALLRQVGRLMRIDDPFFRLSEGVNANLVQKDGSTLINFSSYNYLGLAGDPRVDAAAKQAIDEYGTTVSASRLVSGERRIHQQLETALARAYGVDAALTFVSGHATNVSMLGYLFGPKDLIIHDWFAHNSIFEGIRLSGATRLPFPHQDLEALDAMLTKHRHKHDNVLIVVEGLYSMDGDLPDLPALLEIKKRHDAFLMVDEAHSFGVLGKTGHGLAEHHQVDPREVDIWMGTLSKSLASCGGYIAGSTDLIDNLKHWCPGFLYSVGLPPANAAAALAALDILDREPERVQRLRQVSRHMLETARAYGLDTATAMGHAIIPIMLYDDAKAARFSNAMVQRGVNVLPVIYPAVPAKKSRLRFFLSADHTPEMIDQSFEPLLELLKIKKQPVLSSAA
jgi:8-amino-7-oxononanoate synthase